MSLMHWKEMSSSKCFGRGVHIAHRKDNGYRLLLYQIEGFYVELKYNPGINKIIGLRSFINVNQLEPYLEQIELPKL